MEVRAPVRLFFLILLLTQVLFVFALSAEDEAAATKRILAWKTLIHEKKPADMATLLAQVNHFFNQLPYVPDSPLQGSADVWQTPEEFLRTGSGDCEDFAIAKYFTLAAMDISEKKLKITYVTIPSRNQAHMVLAYYATPDSDPLVLDNLTEKILPASQRPDLTPIYSFNADAVWLTDRTGHSTPYGTVKGLSKWQSLLDRIKLEKDR